MRARVDHGLTRRGTVQLRRVWPAERPTAAMLLLHGIGEHSGRYDHVGRALAERGITVVAIDHEGHGGSGGRRGHITAFDDYVDDAADQLVEVRRIGLPTVLFGHSMGGLIALLEVLEPDRPRPDLLVLSGPALGASIPRPLRLLAPALSMLVPAATVPTRVRPELLSSDPAVAAAYLGDTAVIHTASTSLGAGLLRSMAWANRHLDELDVPTLVLHGGDDRLVPVSSSAPLELLAAVERRLLAGLRHEVCNEPGNHELIDSIASWIAGKVGERAEPR